MNKNPPDAVLWPDLSRFGAQLSVAYNPTCSANFLKFSILDRAKFVANCGLPQNVDFYRLVRELGFTQFDSESVIRANHLEHQLLVEAGMDPKKDILYGQPEALVVDERRKMHFYSPSLVVREEGLRKFLPALEKSDYRMMPVAEVKHLDFCGFQDENLAAFFEEAQSLPDGERVAAWFTTPADRDVLERLDGIPNLLKTVGVLSARQELIDSDDLPLGQPVPDASLRVVERMGRLFMTRRMLNVPTVDMNGVAIKLPGAKALALGYFDRDAAVAANGGSEIGVEQHEWPYALPLAIDYDCKRVLLAKDGRFLQFANWDYQPGQWADLGLKQHLQTYAQLQDAKQQFLSFQRSGLFTADSWVSEDAVSRAQLEHDKFISLLPRELKGRNEIPDVHRLSNRLGYPAGALKEIFGEDFLAAIDAVDGVAEALKTRAAELTAERVRESGMQSAMALAQQAGGGEAGRREDAGEKIGGARKDYAKRWLSVDEISTLTLREMSEVVTKDNIWPSPDWSTYEQRGVPPHVAYMMRELRSALPVNPYRGGYNIKRVYLQKRAAEELTHERCENFVRSVSLVRDKLSDVRDEQSFAWAVYEIRREAGLDFEWRGWDSNCWFGDGAGYDFARTLPLVQVKENVVDGSVTVSSTYELTNAFYAAAQKCERSYSWAVSRKRSADAKPKKEKVEPDIPHLEHIERIGPDYRRGKDVDEALLMDVFGFRAVEYGNWLPQNERQEVLNHTFDAFMDLATALKLPPKAMGLDGAGESLAVAFGARGRGGKSSASAHYEPGRNVINLTRLSGAGCLCHEWGHAFDFWLAKATGLSETLSVSRIESQRNCSPSHLPMLRDFIGILDEFPRRPQSLDEFLTSITRDKNEPSQSFVDRARAELRSWLFGLDRMLPEEKRQGVFLKTAEDLLAECFIPHERFSHLGLARVQGAEHFVTNVTTSLDLLLGAEWRSRYHGDMSYPKRYQEWINKAIDRVEKTASGFTPEKYPAESRFFIDAKYYDGFRSKPYWSTRVELFARAFEAWVQDRVEATPGMTSQYLVHGRRPSEQVEHSAYPRGEERERFAKKMEAFFEDHGPMLISLLARNEAGQERELSLIPA